MADIFKKMNLKEQETVIVSQAPESFEAELEALQDIKVLCDIEAAVEYIKKLTRSKLGAISEEGKARIEKK